MVANHIADYLRSVSPDKIDTSFLAYIANLSEVAKVAPDIAKNIVLELESQRSNLKLISSENYSSLATHACNATHHG
jgi:glycine hydroxymethyltransferase